MTHRFCSRAYTVRIRKELSLFRVILVHPLKDLAQGGLSVAGFAYRQIQRDAQKFALVVVGDAALWTTVVGVTLQPRIHARLFHRLRQVRRTPFEFTNSRCQLLLEV